MTHTRREFIEQSGAVGASAVGLGASAVGLGGLEDQDTRVTRLFIVPRVDEFEDNYVGQWLSVTGTTEPHEEVADNCAFANWEAGTSIAYDALLLDKRSEVPLSISMVAYGDSEPDEVREDTVFIVNIAEVCNDQWIGLSCESVPQRAVVGEPPGPTVDETQGPVGLGGLVAVGAVSIATVLRLLWSGDEE